MTIDIIVALRPEPLEVDPDWEERTRLAITRGRGAAAAPGPRRWVRLVAAAASVAAIVGGVVAAHRWLPREEVIAPAAPVTTPPPGSDEAIFVETAEAMSTMDGVGTRQPTDRTSDAIGTGEFSLGVAPADSYIFFRLGIECTGRAKYDFGANGDFRGAGARCDAERSVTGTAYEFPDKVAAGSTNVLSIRVDRPLHYTVTVGYRTKSMDDVGPRGTLPDGRTYGYQEDGAPDMMLVTGEAGLKGYVDRVDLMDLPDSPEDALRDQRERKQRYRDGERIDRTIPIYDTRGRQVDVFHVMLQDPDD